MVMKPNILKLYNAYELDMILQGESEVPSKLI